LSYKASTYGVLTCYLWRTSLGSKHQKFLCACTPSTNSIYWEGR